MQCAKPIAEYNYTQDTSEVPARVKFSNNSKNAEVFEWQIGDSIVSQSKDLEYDFYTSGRHTVKLKAAKGNTHSIKTKDIYIDAPNVCRVRVLTNYGAMIFELAEETPRHLKNFIDLIEKSYYDNLIFHRVIEGFMIQAGEKGRTVSKVDLESLPQVSEEINSDLCHYRGALAAARMPDDINPSKASSGIQFYIVHGRPTSLEQLEKIEAGLLKNYTKEQKQKYIAQGGAPQLDGEYTVFGYMLDGFEVLDKIASSETNKRDKPVEEVRIETIQILN